MNKDFMRGIRTDMADEAQKLWQGSSRDKSSLPGVRASSTELNGLELTEVQIFDKEGEQVLGKAMGTYYSLLLPENFSRGADSFNAAVISMAELFKRLKVDGKKNILIAALGNPDISPDALGHLAAQNILVTRHLDKSDFPFFNSVSLCRPGVLGTSGIESAQQVRALSRLISAELVIVIDALAGSEAERLCRCVQISDAGISPGSGVGNDRAELSLFSLGVPVISVGMPTVIDAACFGDDYFKGMFVTARNIDALVRAGAKLIAYAINFAVHDGISISDMDMLLS